MMKYLSTFNGTRRSKILPRARGSRSCRHPLFESLERRIALYSVSLLQSQMLQNIAAHIAASGHHPQPAAPQPQMVKDLNTTPESGSPRLPGVTIGKTTFFVANDGVHGSELWKTDGTTVGTTLVKDIAPGPDSYSSYADIREMKAVGNTLYFSADDGVHGQELWKSNGTMAGTAIVKDIEPGSVNSLPMYLTNVNGTLYFTTYTSAKGAGLWKSNGTAAGTVPVITFGQGSDNLRNFSYLDGKFYFTTSSAIHPGIHLYVSDGTAAGTMLPAVFFPGQIEPSYAWDTLGSKTYYIIRNFNDFQLWSSDGSLGRAKLLHDFSGYVGTPVSMNGELFFNARDSENGSQLWKTDGTPGGTVLVTTVNSLSPNSFGSSFYDLTNINGKLFFAASDNSHGQELWISDGSSGGTMMIKDINPGSKSSYPRITNITQNAIFFLATDSTNTQQLWKSNGTTAGTVPVSQIKASNQSHSAVAPFYFAGSDSVHGVELWKSNGTARHNVGKRH